MKSIARNWYWLLLVFFLGAWFCRGMELAFGLVPPPAATGGAKDAGATPLVQSPAVSPTCRTAEPPTRSPWLAVARMDAQTSHVDALVFEWQIWQESGFQTNVVSKAGAIGIAQFMPETAQGYGIDPRDPGQALDAAARLDAGHLAQYAGDAEVLARQYGGNQARYDYALALAAYNAGPGALASAWRAAYGGGWPASGAWAWLAQMAGETRAYVPAILGCSL